MAVELGPRFGPISGSAVGALVGWMQVEQSRRALVVVDQAEEFFNMSEFGERQKAFLGALANAQDTLGDRLRIVATVRSDFEPAVRKAFEDFGPPGWLDGRFAVAPVLAE